jgi:hypothetical protein
MKKRFYLVKLAYPQVPDAVRFVYNPSDMYLDTYTGIIL